MATRGRGRPPAFFHFATPLCHPAQRLDGTVVSGIFNIRTDNSAVYRFDDPPETRYDR